MPRMLIWIVCGILVVTLSACPPKDSKEAYFELTSSVASVTIMQGESQTLDISVASFNGFAETVELSVIQVPEGVTTAFSANPTDTNSQLTISTALDAVVGEYSLTISGESATKTYDLNLPVTVQEQKELGDTGELELTFTGLPEPWQNEGYVVLEGLGDFRNAYFESQRIDDLAEGSYTLTVQPLSLCEGESYVGETSTFTLEVQGGSTLTQEISYVPGIGAQGFSGNASGIHSVGSRHDSWVWAIVEDDLLKLYGCVVNSNDRGIDYFLNGASLYQGNYKDFFIEDWQWTQALTITSCNVNRGLPCKEYVSGSVQLSDALKEALATGMLYFGGYDNLNPGSVALIPLLADDGSMSAPVGGTLVVETNLGELPNAVRETIDICVLGIFDISTYGDGLGDGALSCSIKTERYEDVFSGSYRILELDEIRDPEDSTAVYLSLVTGEPAEVTSGSVSTITVDYLQAGTLTIEVIPENIYEKITVKGPSGEQAVFDGETSLLPGTYEVTAEPSTLFGSDKLLYPTVTTSTIEIESGAVTNLLIEYRDEPTFETGTLELSFSGLPGPWRDEGYVILEGPGGFREAYFDTQVIEDVPAGSYTLAVQSITVCDGETYSGDTATFGLEIEAGARTSRAINYVSGMGTQGFSGNATGVHSDLTVQRAWMWSVLEGNTFKLYGCILDENTAARNIVVGADIYRGNYRDYYLFPEKLFTLEFQNCPDVSEPCKIYVSGDAIFSEELKQALNRGEIYYAHYGDPNRPEPEYSIMIFPLIADNGSVPKPVGGTLNVPISVTKLPIEIMNTSIIVCIESDINLGDMGYSCADRSFEQTEEPVRFTDLYSATYNLNLIDLVDPNDTENVYIARIEGSPADVRVGTTVTVNAEYIQAGKLVVQTEPKSIRTNIIVEVDGSEKEIDSRETFLLPGSYEVVVAPSTQSDSDTVLYPDVSNFTLDIQSGVTTTVEITYSEVP